MSAVLEPAMVPDPRIAAPALRRALAAGMRRVLARREWLDSINVFPVPDGDTGSNLAFTLSAVLSRSLSRRARSVGELLRQVAEDAIDGARGNSGAILAQFFHGVGEAIGSARVVTPPLLGEAVRHGATQAREALADPREGTIISVIRAFADSLHWQHGSDPRHWFGAALARARTALADTPRQLAVLRQAGVVDAGAQGFVDLLEGIDDWLRTGAEPEATDVEALPAFAGEHWHGEPDCDEPWCSECLLQVPPEAAPIDRAGLQAALAALGASSVVVAGGAQRLRVHAHVAEPGAFFETAARFGTVGARKAEDMRMQHRSAVDVAGVAVLTDSGADLPEDIRRALNIQMVAARVSFGDEEFLDKVSLSPREFYRRLRESPQLPKTSQPPPGDFRRQFDCLLSHHAEAVYVGLSRAVSGTLQSAEAAAARAGGSRIAVIDSGHASCGEGLLAIAAAEAAHAGADAAAIRAHIEALRRQTETFAIARDVSYGVRGGRVPRWAGPLLQGFGLTPVARMRRDGRLGVVGALLGRHQLPQRFARYIARRLPRGQRWRVLVGHCGCAEDGARLLQALRDALDCEAGWLVEAGPAIGAHAGPGALVVGVQPAPDTAAASPPVPAAGLADPHG
jgi:uncharacterized protein